jgi:hypothetical protein
VLIPEVGSGFSLAPVSPPALLEELLWEFRFQVMTGRHSLQKKKCNHYVRTSNERSVNRFHNGSKI